jgi:hypothetical protein
MPASIGGWHLLVLLTFSLVSASRSWTVEEHAAVAVAQVPAVGVAQHEVPAAAVALATAGDALAAAGDAALLPGAAGSRY